MSIDSQIKVPLENLETAYLDYAKNIGVQKDWEGHLAYEEKRLKTQRTPLDEKQNLLKNRQATWIGHIVKLLDSKSGITGLICSFLSHFKWFRNELNDQRKINSEIIDMEPDINKYIKKFNKQKDEFKRIQDENRDSLAMYPKLNNVENVFELMVSIIGGKEKYNNLKVVKIREESDPKYKYVMSKDMIEPIMRFTTKEGTPGFVIRLQADKEQLFFQKYKDKPTWITWGYPVISPRNNIMVDSGVVDVCAFKQLKELIKTEKLTDFRKLAYTLE
ncbi:MAG: hypothetical protein H0W88_00270 [Parachlamydiaceae bacterium]|nr:hypothetical protein [Parachlamydiaceae bacterium]